MVLTKHHINKRNQKELTISEIFSANVAFVTETKKYELNNVELKKENDIKSKMFKDVGEKTLENMYLDDLSDFMKEYEKFEKEKLNKNDDSIPMKKKNIRKGAGKKKK